MSFIGLVHPSGVPETLIDMIEESPDLAELNLNIYSYDREGTPSQGWRPFELFRVLKNPLSKLRHLTMRGEYVLDWNELVQDSPGSRPLRSFFEQHPHLQEIHLDGKQTNDQPGPIVNSALMPRLFPSLKRFTGSSTLCAALVNSKLAVQLESLRVRLEKRDSSDSVGMQISFPYVLPRLKEFGFVDHNPFGAHPESETVNSDALTKLLAMTPSLTSLSISCFYVELVRRAYIPN